MGKWGDGERWPPRARGRSLEDVDGGWRLLAWLKGERERERERERGGGKREIIASYRLQNVHMSRSNIQV